MRSKKIVIALFFCFSVIFAQKDSTDSSKKEPHIQSVVNNVEIKSNSKPLAKRAEIKKNPTTWTKIKDLFM